MATRYTGIIHNKNTNGEYDELLPINTIDEVYYDIANNIGLREILNQLISYKKVDSMESLYALTTNDVVEGSIVKVENGDSYRVVDTDNLSNENGYEKVTNLGGAGTAVTLMTYNSSDLN